MVGCVAEWCPTPQIIFLNFQVKTAGFMYFCCEKLIVARNPDQGELIDPLGAELC